MWYRYIRKDLKLILLIGTFIWGLGSIYAQTIPAGISYQAVLNDEEGLPMKNQAVQLRIALTAGPDQNKVFYIENQVVQTDDQGIINLILGADDQSQSIIRRVPWAEQNIWMNIELLEDNGRYKLISQGSFYAVPYAFHAGSAKNIIPQDTALLRTGQSITWNVRGNYKTDPNIHFLGTIDEEALFFKTNNTTRLVIAANGQSTYYTDLGVTGADDEKAAYPVVIEGGKQGIYIEIQESRSTDNNFLTFADTEDIHGTVEGQTALEYYGSFDYLFPLGIQLFDIGVNVANAIAGAIEGGGLAAALSPGSAVKFAFLAEIAKSIATQTAQLIAWQVEVALSIGVSYTTGSADYAEWLEKQNPQEDFMAGEVIGVKNGKISRSTKDADHLLVISHRPLSLGNVPAKEEEYKFEKVAMKGQVPVFVVGQVNLGDYILPSGNEDGMAIAVGPDQMKTGDYHRIIGVAWQAAVAAPVNLVNVAVGINTNDLSHKVEDIEQKLDLIMDYLSGSAQMVEGKIVPNASGEHPIQAALAEHTKLNPFFSDEKYNQYLDEHADEYQAVFDMAGDYLKEMDIDISKHPEIERLYDDPVAFYKNMRKDPRMQTYMGYFDKTILAKEAELENSNH
jgi:hypothetical protein